MPETEAYRPGLLSSFLLGDGAGEGGGAGEDSNATATPSSKKKAGSVGVSGVKEALAEEQQQCADTSASTSAGSPPSATKKKKKKKKDKGEREQSAPSTGGNALGGGGRAAAESLRPAAAAAGEAAKQEPLEEAPDLASLFSTSNLKKFKRRERLDKEADAAEVCIRVDACRRGCSVCASCRVYNTALSIDYMQHLFATPFWFKFYLARRTTSAQIPTRTTL